MCSHTKQRTNSQFVEPVGGGGGGKVKKFIVELRMESGESVIKAIEIMMGEVEIMAFYLLSMDTLS